MEYIIVAAIFGFFAWRMNRRYKRIEMALRQRQALNYPSLKATSKGTDVNPFEDELPACPSFVHWYDGAALPPHLENESIISFHD